MENYDKLREAIENRTCEEFFQKLYITEQTAIQAFYLCQYYFTQIQTFIDIIEIGDKFKNERRFVNYLYKCPGYRASRTDIINNTHLSSKEINFCVINLEDQEAVLEEYDNISTKAKKPTFYYQLLPCAVKLYGLKKRK